jgi:ABC-type multidrug transport system fused ATPase/permease subunit
MNKKSKYSQFDSFSGSEVKKENSVDTNETHLLAGIISFIFPAWGELIRGHYKKWLLYSFIITPLLVVAWFGLALTGIGIPIGSIIFLLYQIKCARMSYNDKGLTEGLSGFFTKRNILIIILVVVIGIFVIRTIGLMYTEQQKAHLANVTNNITNNTTGVNTTVEKISNDDNQQKVQSDSESDSQSSNGEEMVRWNGGYCEKGKVDIIAQYGMGPESEQKMKEAGY